MGMTEEYIRLDVHSQASVGTVRFVSTVPDVLEALAMHVQVVAMSLAHKEKVHMTLAHVEGGKMVC